MPPPAEGFASRLFLGPALRTQPDRRLVTLVREGYEAAFEEIVRRYGRPLGRYAASIVGSRSEDVTQDAFSKALLALRRDDAEIDLRPWLFRIVRNTALNDLRDSPPSPEALAEAITGGGNPAEELERREELADLIKRLQALPEPQRAAIVMRELEGLGHEEIAAALGLSGGAARQAIYRARQALRDGAGMLIPLPLIQAMLAGAGPSAAETAVGAANVGSAAGMGVALKATAATVLVAGAVGTGVAIKDGPRGGDAEAAPARAAQSSAADPAPTQLTTAGGEGEGDDRSDSGHERGDEGDRGRNSGEPERGDDRGEAEPGNDRGGESELVDDHRGHGEAEPGDDHGGRHFSGRGGSSGPGGGNDRSGSSGGSSGPGGHGGSGHGGPGPSGGSESGSSGSGHGGSGSGDGGDDSGSSLDDSESHGGSGSGGDETEASPPTDSSGPGSGETSDSGGGDGLSG
jgi:RNA polymerase sigma factor (sigma-70 family)